MMSDMQTAPLRGGGNYAVNTNTSQSILGRNERNLYSVYWMKIGGATPAKILIHTYDAPLTKLERKTVYLLDKPKWRSRVLKISTMWAMQWPAQAWRLEGSSRH